MIVKIIIGDALQLDTLAIHHINVGPEAEGGVAVALESDLRTIGRPVRTPVVMVEGIG